MSGDGLLPRQTVKGGGSPGTRSCIPEFTSACREIGPIWHESCLIPRHGVSMPVLTIRHVTTYRYRQPVAFGEHRIMLRPRDSCDQRLLEANLAISPEPPSLR